MSKEDFIKKHMLNLRGKAYLPVAPRVVMFRLEHPTAQITTATKDIGDDTYVFCAIGDGTDIWATAHKRVKKNGSGASKDYPLETAETGAIGRALALCGYGTIESRDLEEGDQLADAPVETTQPQSEKRECIAVTPESAQAYMKTAKTVEQLAELKPKLREMAKMLEPDERKKLVAAVKAYEKELKGDA